MRKDMFAHADIWTDKFTLVESIKNVTHLFLKLALFFLYELTHHKLTAFKKKGPCFPKRLLFGYFAYSSKVM